MQEEISASHVKMNIVALILGCASNQVNEDGLLRWEHLGSLPLFTPRLINAQPDNWSPVPPLSAAGPPANHCPKLG